MSLRSSRLRLLAFNGSSKLVIIAVSIVTVILSGVVAALVSAVLSASKDQLIFRQRKAEELFLAVDRWDKHFSTQFLPYYRFLKDELTLEQVYDLIIKSAERQGGDTGRDHAQMFMLTKFYFPDLKPVLADYDAARAAVVKVAHACEKKKSGLMEFDSAMKEFDRSSVRFKDTIVLEGQKYSDIDIFVEAKRIAFRALKASR